MYYIYNDNNEIVGKSDTFNDSVMQMYSPKDIILDRLKLFNGEVYDVDDIEYWRILRTDELAKYCEAIENGYCTVSGYKMDCTEKSVGKLSLGLQLYEMNGLSDDKEVIMVDYNNIAHSITLATYKLICKQVGNEYSSKYMNKWAIRSTIQNGTLEDLKNLVIGGNE